jgi:hypothetical protein
MYYEALSLADTGVYEPIVELVAENCSILFSEYIRLRDESNRLKEWAKKIGNKDQQKRLSKTKTEFELWLNKVNQIKLEFKQAVNILDDTIESYYISFYEYPALTLEKYQQLKDNGTAPATNFFSIRFHNKDTNKIVATFMFRFFRNKDKYPYAKTAIPLELNYFDKETDDFNFIGYFDKAKKIELRSFYINEKGETVVRFIKPEDEKYYEHETTTERVTDVVMKFFDQVFENIIGL